ncbi:MAG: hypothetical protein HKO65_05295 [Gemmatimonadetes bacterium]|nr:hypothetical protein [Gemmatimonadota bacterium]
MPLTYLLYRCPRCGNDPLEGSKDEANCPACGLAFARGGEGGLIRILDPSGEAWEVPGHRLASEVQGWTEKRLAEDRPGDAIIHSAVVRVRQSGPESPVHWGGGLLGFAEAMGEAVGGMLLLSREALTFDSGKKAGPHPGNPSGPGPTGRKTWPLLDIRAVQTSSSTLQFSPADGGLVEFKFPEDSPFRWETLLRGTLKRVYRAEGLGEIVEFQPRIVTE